jgi:hypothetical protein
VLSASITVALQLTLLGLGNCAGTPAERARLRQEIVAQNHRMLAKEALKLCVSLSSS